MKSEGGGVVVILSARDKEEVEGEVRCCCSSKRVSSHAAHLCAPPARQTLRPQLKEQFSPKELCGSTVVCRTGSPLLMSDLNKVAGECSLQSSGFCRASRVRDHPALANCGAASDARAIVILAEPGPPDKADAQVLRTVLGLMGLRRPIRVRGWLGVVCAGCVVVKADSAWRRVFVTDTCRGGAAGYRQRRLGKDHWSRLGGDGGIARHDWYG